MLRSRASGRSSARCRSLRGWRGGAGPTPTTGSPRCTRRSVGRMATEIKLPRLGQGMESGTIVKWLKSEGDAVKKGEPLYELDTDKVTQEVEADATGVLLKIAVQEGEVPVGQTVAVIGEQGEEVAIEVAPEEPQTEGSRAPERDAERERGSEASAQTATASGNGATRSEGRVKASPLARRIARERGVDLAQLRG